MCYLVKNNLKLMTKNETIKKLHSAVILEMHPLYRRKRELKLTVSFFSQKFNACGRMIIQTE